MIRTLSPARAVRSDGCPFPFAYFARAEGIAVVTPLLTSPSPAVRVASLKALLKLAPDVDYVYFGDTARLPYGSKSVETVAKYAVEAARFLEQRQAQMLVIACNTATALALDQITAAAKVPVVVTLPLGS